MLDAIRIENLRSIQDSNYIDLKSLNILVGANSSGKSTFLRSFPLLSQSISKSLRGPVSWFDVTSVDFGDYSTAKNKYVSEKETIRFSFKMSQLKINRLEYTYFRYINYYKYRSLVSEFESDIKVTISLNNDMKGTFIDLIVLELKRFTIEMFVENRSSSVKILINGEIDMSDYGVKNKWSFTTNHGIMPTFIGKDNEDFQVQTLKLAVNKLIQFCDSRLKRKDRIESLFNLCDNSKESLLKSIKNSEIVSLRKKTADWDIYNETFQEVYYLWVTSQIPLFLWVVDEELKKFYRDCSYIAPSRAEASRYYRYQGLQVKDVDAYGRNMQEFISSLTDKQYESYSSFTKDILGINIGVANSTGHQSIFLQSDNGKFNLADVGFGYSQILPIITKLWYITQKKPYEEDAKRCVVIEQPELHLHPAMQAKIADAFIKAISEGRKNNINIKLFIETHSQSLINRIGRRISEKKIGPDKVSLMIFEKDNEGKNTIIKQTYFKENGQIKDWPYGFFDPVDF